MTPYIFMNVPKDVIDGAAPLKPSIAEMKHPFIDIDENGETRYLFSAGWIHAYLLYSDALSCFHRLVFDRVYDVYYNVKRLAIFECEIPVGSEYVISTDKTEIATDQLMFVNKIVLEKNIDFFRNCVLKLS